MPYYYYYSTSTEQIPGFYRYHSPMGMMGGYPSGNYGWFNYGGMMIFNIIILILMVLAVVWFVKQIKK